jgi:hypothetical protein
MFLGMNSQLINYGRYAIQLRMLVPDGASILGEGSWWWEFRDHPFTSDYYLVLIDLVNPGLSEREILEMVVKERQINVILLDEKINFFYLETNAFYDAIRTETKAYIESNCHLAGTISDYSYGIEQGGPAVKSTQVYICP